MSLCPGRDAGGSVKRMNYFTACNHPMRQDYVVLPFFKYEKMGVLSNFSKVTWLVFLTNVLGDRYIRQVWERAALRNAMLFSG